MIFWDNLDKEIGDLALRFFYWFSRFEFALKQNGQVRRGPRDSAQADWSAFIAENEDSYVPCGAVNQLMEKPPNIQHIDGQYGWRWESLRLNRNSSALFNAVLLVKTIRNNLFHGGKHTAAGWDDPERIRFLLTKGVEALDSFAKLSCYEADYRRKY